MSETIQNHCIYLDSLSDISKRIMHLKALLFTGHTKTEFLKCVIDANICGEIDGKINFITLNLLLKPLIDAKLLTELGVCNKDIVHEVTIDAVNDPYITTYLDAIEKNFPNASYHSYDVLNVRRKIRIAIYTCDEKRLSSLLKEYFSIDDLFNMLDNDFVFQYFDANWLNTRPAIFKDFLFFKKLNFLLHTAQETPNLDDMISQYKEIKNVDALHLFGILLILRGQYDFAEKVLESIQEDSLIHKFIRSALAFVCGNNDDAIYYHEQALDVNKKAMNKRKYFFCTIDSIFYILALIKKNSQKSLKTAEDAIQFIEKSKETFNVLFFTTLKPIILMLTNSDFSAKKYLELLYEQLYSDKIIPNAFFALSIYFVNPEMLKDKVDVYAEFFEKCKNTLPIIAKIFAEILVNITESNEEYREYLKNPVFKNTISFTEIIHLDPPWLRALDTLEETVSGFSSQSSYTGNKRLIWFIDIRNKAIDFAEQSMNNKGEWTKGKRIAMKRLYERDPQLNYLTDHDIKVIKTMHKYTYRQFYYPEIIYEWDKNKTILALVGHPLVFLMNDPSCNIHLIEKAPELIVTQVKNSYHIVLSHPTSNPEIFLEQETPTNFNVINCTKQIVDVCNIIGSLGIKVPIDTKKQVLSIVKKASSLLSVNCDISDDEMQIIEAYDNCYVHLIILETGLKVNLLVRPFKDHGPYYRPCHGNNKVIDTTKGKHKKAIRNFTREYENANSLIQFSNVLTQLNDGTDEWIIDDIEECLEVLNDLNNYDKTIHIEWPKGQKLSISNPVSFENLSLNIHRKNEWFHIDGKIFLDQDQVIEMKQLLDLIDDAKGRFIPISDNKFLALTNHFKKKLQELKYISTKTKDDNKIHYFGANILQQFCENSSQVKGDKGWKDFQDKLSNASSHDPKVSSNFQGELRNYQLEGYRWLSQLAYWGAGACLADDMGLGKTIQAIVLILEHAPKGPCLIIAPTSLIYNWQEECAKFAPALNTVLFYKNRDEEQIKKLKNMDLLICSYGLLQQQEELLSSIPWQIIILDEAQAIKNKEAKRTQAVMKLHSNIRVVLTGTPIENHLGELWSIFRFINPGLLGSYESFQQRFAIPIERDKDIAAKQILKKLIQPFILRRIKNKVLEELPPRTEKTLLIEMDDEEAAFYHALRQIAIENINKKQDTVEQLRFHILSEITRLRRACCHPKLIDDNIKISSSKLNTFLDLVETLKENNHKALVFSQYVGFLSIVRNSLDESKISYQYIDGQTPVKTRGERVNAFQAGESDLFLISLKAGGMGLNLTAADYVIHLDPWWNPAVEDQASDRAHRIGQQHPVTIYRFIMKDSIEEKIVALHKDKRNLANDLLSGNEISGKLSEKELLQLIMST